METGFLIDNQSVATLRQWVDKAENIVIVAHRNADGDAMGSSLGMMHVLRGLGKKAVVALPNGCPNTFDWMPACDTILSGESQHEACARAIGGADLLIGTDFNQMHRISLLSEVFKNAQCRKVLIDHHLGPEREAFNLVFSEPEMSSASELCYWVAQAAWGADAIGLDAASCFYTGMRTDTGQFSFSCSQPSLYTAAGQIIARGIDPDRINHLISDNFSPERLRFYAFAVSQRLHVFDEQHFAYFAFNKGELHRSGVTAAELDGLVNYALKLKHIEVGVLIREEAKRIKISFRSKFNYNVERIAREYFGGGGHHKASGADVTDSTLEDVVAQIEDLFLNREPVKDFPAICAPPQKACARKEQPSAAAQKTCSRLPLILLAATTMAAVAGCGETPIIEQEQPQANNFKQHSEQANHYLAEREETNINAYISRRGWQVAMLPCGARLHEIERGTGDEIHNGDDVTLRYSVETLSGEQLYTDTTEQVQAGHLTPCEAVDAALLTLRRGSRVQVVAPSSTAFGVRGDGYRIPPRTALVYTLEIK